MFPKELCLSATPSHVGTPQAPHTVAVPSDIKGRVPGVQPNNGHGTLTPCIPWGNMAPQDWAGDTEFSADRGSWQGARNPQGARNLQGACWKKAGVTWADSRVEGGEGMAGSCHAHTTLS